uniref:Protein CPR-5 n=1 Tax=Solanum tuberosum TaxID=4113 RepID=M1AZJ8_SOLTU
MDIFYVPGTQVLVDAPINVIHQFRTATLTVSGSSSQSHAIWCFADIGYSLFTSPALCNFKSDYASYFHSVAVGSWLRFCREVLY